MKSSISEETITQGGPATTFGETPAVPHHGGGPAAEELTMTLDVGTLMGWSILAGQKIVDSGTVLLASEEELKEQRREGKERTGDIRFARCLNFIEMKINSGVGRIVFEDVTFLGSQDQTQLWGSLRASIWLVAFRSRIIVCCVPVTTLKVFATGDGGADKLKMAQALHKAEPAQYLQDPETGILARGDRPLDDNEVDAIWLARYTAAVDRGEKDFLGAFQRKAARKAERRARKVAARAQKKIREAARETEARIKRAALIAAVKNAGKCCGVFRKPAPFGKAICPKCGQAIRIPKLAEAGAPAHASPAKIPIAQ